MERITWDWGEASIDNEPYDADELRTYWGAALVAAERHGYTVHQRYMERPRILRKSLFKDVGHKAKKFASWISFYSEPENERLRKTEHRWKFRLDVFVPCGVDGPLTEEQLILVVRIDNLDAPEFYTFDSVVNTITDVSYSRPLLVNVVREHAKRLTSFPHKWPYHLITEDRRFMFSSTKLMAPNPHSPARPSASEQRSPRSNTAKTRNQGQKKRKITVVEDSSDDDSEYGNPALKPENLNFEITSAAADTTVNNISQPSTPNGQVGICTSTDLSANPTANLTLDTPQPYTPSGRVTATTSRPSRSNNIRHLDRESLELESARKRIKTLEATNKGLEVSKNGLEASSKGLKATNKELGVKNKDLETSNKALGASAKILDASNKTLEASNKELQAEKKSLGESKKDLVAENKSLESLNKCFEAKSNGLEDSIKRLEDENKGLKASYKSLEASNKGLEAVNRILVLNIVELQEKLKDADDRVQELTRR
ncbi:uncharacterized protein K452DRAFT_302489 [Aplosporella prunicola CBS 121167]|uniref:Uncharacterized protein n=1 Tax=Aplosporella prunicola CBS 121167 TaxID=1176127 RepID=A0A6A6AYE9_9PEZI|nr:uncharacterized protein K452DRAFT_303018 [Aplosporella prunicola CBS 121167]XP_033392518.1 uncharacterized protein K452DRAFT_302489 [Aplosporella prunicola CBS 121167]KAF2136126.1 hypothetical protein K452DRAFT_303018 [Aplosporella prunicola CBS 121167]KAF2136800.1 hypothetical protein K452DRAFT_302489 [Aplosporella prunicola CBS 121167]